MGFSNPPAGGGTAIAIPSEALELLAHRYLDAKESVVTAGFGHEIDWQADRGDQEVSECELLTEAAWVILNAGMREQVIRGLFPRVVQSFLGFGSAARIVDEAFSCRERATQVFNHRRKIEAIIAFASATVELTAAGVVSAVESHGPEWLLGLPYFGPATSRHLAKNLGLDIAKPDRHLQRLAFDHGFPNAQALCEALSSLTGDSVSVIDIVLWRHSNLSTHDPRRFLRRASRPAQSLDSYRRSEPVAVVTKAKRLAPVMQS